MTTEFKTVGFSSLPTTEKFVAFIDILGFASRITHDFTQAERLYDSVVDHLAMINDTPGVKVNVRMISDSILLVSSDLISLIVGANLVQHAALMCNLLVRGGIAHGLHKELSTNDNLYVASEALVRAVKLEKEVRRPCVVLHKSLSPPPNMILPLPDNNFLRKLLYVEGKWIVSPFSIIWGFSASTRVGQLREQYPEHSEKFDWFLKLYEDVRNGEPLLPPEWLRNST